MLSRPLLMTGRSRRKGDRGTIVKNHNSNYSTALSIVKFTPTVFHPLWP